MRCLKFVLFGLWAVGLILSPLVWAQPAEDCPDCPPKADDPIDLGDMFVTAFHGGGCDPSRAT